MPKDYFPDLSVGHKIYGSDISRKYVWIRFPWGKGIGRMYRGRPRNSLSDEKAGDPNRLENILHRTPFSHGIASRYTGPENESLSFFIAWVKISLFFSSMVLVAISINSIRSFSRNTSPGICRSTRPTSLPIADTSGEPFYLCPSGLSENEIGQSYFFAELVLFRSGCPAGGRRKRADGNKKERQYAVELTIGIKMSVPVPCIVPLCFFTVVETNHR